MGLNVIYNDVDLSQYFSVVDIKRSILPDRTNYYDSVPFKAGATYIGSKYEPISIEINILINDNLNEKKETLASILNVKEPKKLIFTDEVDRYYNAVIDGSTNIDEVLKLGTGVLSFICLDPMAYSVDSTIVDLVNIKDRKTVINVGGTYETYPKIEVDFMGDSKLFGLTTKKGNIQVGTPDYVDGITRIKSETLIETKDFKGFIYNDLPLNTVGGSKQGSFNVKPNIDSTNPLFKPLEVTDYGDITTSGFNGPSYSKAFTETKNFDAILDLDFGTLDVEGLKNGKFEFNISDSSNNIIAGISLTDTSSIPLMSPQFYTSLNDYSVSSSVSLLEDDVLNSESLGRWNNFKGYLRIVKSGNDIVFTIQKMDKDKIVRKYSYTFTSSKYNTEKAVKVGFWFSRFGTTQPLDSAIVNSLKFIKNNVDDWVDVPNLFQKGDKLVIDNLLGRIYLNELEYMDYLDIGSTFFSLDSGLNNLLFTYSSTLAPKVKIIYKDCYI